MPGFILRANGATGSDLGDEVEGAGESMRLGDKNPGCGLIARLGLVMAASLALAACSGGSRYAYRDVPKGGGSYKVGQPYRINGRTYYPNEDPNYRAEGTASWYGPDFHGKPTANGEIYDMNAISAAHPTLPIPSYARVTNLRNGRSLVVRVNDRGPYVGNRLIDLSVGAAKALDFHGEGLARVRVEYVGRAPLEGSDDRMLLATLRQGTPAPAPGNVMLASATPAAPVRDEPATGAPPRRGDSLPTMASGRSPALGAPPPPKPAAKPAPVDTPVLAQAQARVVTLPVKPRRDDPPSAGGPPMGSNLPPGSLGLMSGRGLY
jgi:rare lipoprotein A